MIGHRGAPTFCWGSWQWLTSSIMVDTLYNGWQPLQWLASSTMVDKLYNGWEPLQWLRASVMVDKLYTSPHCLSNFRSKLKAQPDGLFNRCTTNIYNMYNTAVLLILIIIVLFQRYNGWYWPVPQVSSLPPEAEVQWLAVKMLSLSYHASRVRVTVKANYVSTIWSKMGQVSSNDVKQGSNVRALSSGTTECIAVEGSPILVRVGQLGMARSFY